MPLLSSIFHKGPKRPLQAVWMAYSSWLQVGLSRYFYDTFAVKGRSGQPVNYVKIDRCFAVN